MCLAPRAHTPVLSCTAVRGRATVTCPTLLRFPRHEVEAWDERRADRHADGHAACWHFTWRCTQAIPLPLCHNPRGIGAGQPGRRILSRICISGTLPTGMCFARSPSFSPSLPHPPSPPPLPFSFSWPVNDGRSFFCVHLSCVFCVCCRGRWRVDLSRDLFISGWLILVKLGNLPSP